jgi:hypothetical protein
MNTTNPSERAAGIIAAARALHLPDILTAEALAGHLSCRPETVRRMFRSGELPGRKLGRRWFASKAEILRAIAVGTGP